MYNTIHSSDGGGLAYLDVVQAAVVVTNSREMFQKPDADPVNVAVKGDTKGEKKVVPWGSSNDLPMQIISKVGKSPDMSTNMLFNISAGYGEGVIPVRRVFEKGRMSLVPVFDNKDINAFLEENDVNDFVLEQLTDINYFYQAFPEIILNRDVPAKRKVVELNHKDAAFSRWSPMNLDGHIPYHYYSPYWGEKTPTKDEVVETSVLSRKNPVLDLMRRIGRVAYANGKMKDEMVYRYIIPVNFPSPGRLYYNKPYWYSLIESGWYDFALLIPEFKKALLQNQMTIKYMIYIHEQYFPNIFAEEGITTDTDKKARVAKEYDNIQNFLANAKNSGKATISKIKYAPDGKEIPMIKIIPIENHFKGGEYIEDSEEVSNIIAYGMGVHSSLIGSHGKSKTINGTEARELFIIKQAMLKPIRDRVLKPLHVVKAVNKWPEDIYFTIPNLELTTLDNGTGSKKVIS